TGLFGDLHRDWDGRGDVRDRPDALRALDRRLSAAPDDAEARRTRAALLASRGEWDRAAADFREAARLAGGKAPPWYASGWWLTRGTDADPIADVPDPARPPPPAERALVFVPAPRDANDFIDLTDLRDAIAVQWVFARGAQERLLVLGPGSDARV